LPELLLSVLVSGGDGRSAAAVASARDRFGLADGLAVGSGGGLSLGLADGLAVGSGGGLSLGLADGLAVGSGGGLGDRMALLTMLAEQMTRPPPPEPEPLHWSIVTGWVDDIVPVAVQVS
jgi:hypothetical protein